MKKDFSFKEIECFTCLGTGYIFEGEDENKADYIKCPECEGHGSLVIIEDEEFEDSNNLYI
jgi:hypothetical protein